MSWTYKELPFHRTALLSDCRELKSDDIVDLITKVSGLYRSPIEMLAKRPDDHPNLLIRIRFHPTPRNHFNNLDENTVTDGRIIGEIYID